VVAEAEGRKMDKLNQPGGGFTALWYRTRTCVDNLLFILAKFEP